MTRPVCTQRDRRSGHSPTSPVAMLPGVVSARTSTSIGAIGPVRMEYGRTIAGVEFMSALMTDLVETVRA